MNHYGLRLSNNSPNLALFNRNKLVGHVEDFENRCTLRVHASCIVWMTSAVAGNFGEVITNDSECIISVQLTRKVT